MGDFNGDGVLDLAVSVQYSNAISVLLGLGDGTLAAEHRFPLGSAPFSVAAADLNGDGLIDLAVTSGDVIILLNNTPSSGATMRAHADR